jgi:hypothetical protein
MVATRLLMALLGHADLTLQIAPNLEAKRTWRGHAEFVGF